MTRGIAAPPYVGRAPHIRVRPHPPPHGRGVLAFPVPFITTRPRPSRPDQPDRIKWRFPCLPNQPLRRRWRSPTTARSCRSCSPTARGRTGHRQGAAVVLGRPARRQPGPHRPDGPDPEAAPVRGAGRDGLQGDRGRLPVGQPARLRLRPPADRGGSDPRRRDDPGAHPVPPGADRAHVREPRRAHRRAIVHFYNSTNPLQREVVFGLDKQGIIDVAVSAAKLCRKLEREMGGTDDPVRVLAGELHAHRARLRHRDLRGRDGRRSSRRRTSRSSSTCRPPSSATPRTCTAT